MAKIGRLLLIGALALSVQGGTARAQEPVDVALVLAIDISRSMSPAELEIQRQGYASAINHPDVIRAIGQGAYGRIAVTMFTWAADFHQQEIFDWTVIETAGDADKLSEMIVATPIDGRSRTSVSGAIDRGIQKIGEARFEALRKVIDISGDGPNNQGGPVLDARERALERQIVINGLPLMTQDGPGYGFNIDDLDVYYADCVIAGPGSFLVPVDSWEQFPEAVRRKLVQEIGGIGPPEARVIPAQAPEEASDCMIGEKIWQQRRWQFNMP